MKKIIILSVLMGVVLAVSMQVHADLNLIGQGTSIHGTYNLVYDTDFDITWYGYSNSVANWDNQMNWASALTVDFGGTILDNWRLPITAGGENHNYTYGYDGTSTAGFNITSSEMGHLFYAELSNKGAFDTAGNLIGCSDTCLKNMGDLQLYSTLYWSKTELNVGGNNSWNFNFGNGHQDSHITYENRLYRGIAVYDGNVAAPVVPEPISSILFITGGSLLAGRRYLKRKKHNNALL